MLDLYGIIAQGANDIMDIRHGIKEVQDIRRSASAPATRSTGQVDIRDWLIDSSGLSGAERRARLAGPAMVEDAESVVSEDHIESFRWCTVECPTVWIPDVSEADRTIVEERLAGAANERQILATVDCYEVQQRSLHWLLNGEEIDSTVVDSYLRLVQKRITSRHVKCMGTSFFKRLYNPGGGNRYQPSDTLNLDYVTQFTKGLDIFQYQLLLIPLLVRHHWSIIAVDMRADSIQYFDSGPGDGMQYLAIIKRWIAHEWKSNSAYNTTEFPSHKWRMIPSDSLVTPQQTGRTDCGVFMMMFAELLADGQQVDRFDAQSGSTARMYIAHGIMRGHVSHSAGGIPSQPANTCRTESAIENTDARSCSLGRTTGSSTKRDRLLPTDWDTAIASLSDGAWLTDTVLDHYFQLLTRRSQSTGSACKFYSTHVINRIYDDQSKSLRSHLHLHDGVVMTMADRSEIQSIRDMHGHEELFMCDRAYLPASLTNHYCLIVWHAHYLRYGYILCG